MNSFIPLKPLSQTLGAVYMRTKYLTDDEWNEKVRTADKARKRLVRNSTILKQRTEAARKVNYSGALSRRIAHHLSRGRDAADIAIRENVPVSIVVKLVEELR